MKERSMEPRRAELTDYHEIRSAVSTALQSGDLSKAKMVLEGTVKHADSTRSASENLFVYRSLGNLYGEIGMDDEALRSFVTAYASDSRDLDTLKALATVMLEGAESEDTLEVMTRLLVFHRYALRPSMVARIYVSIAGYHKTSGNLERARTSYEKALEVRPGDMGIINALLGVAEESGDDQAVLAVREKLLTTLTNAESRAAVLVAIGDDYIKKFDDANRAIDAFERALAECATSQPALLRVADLSIRQEDWSRAVRSLITLGDVADEADAKVKYLSKAAVVYRDKLGEHTRAIQVYNKILDIDPLQLDSFKAIARLLLDMEDWTSLEANYENMIARQKALESVQTNVLVVLYRNLGELQLKQLNSAKRAAISYQEASDLLPDDLGFHQILADLYALDDETLALAIDQHRQILRLAPDRLESVDALANLYRKMESFDRSLCVFRVLDTLGRAGEEGGRIVERYRSPRAPKVEGAFTDEIWNSYLRPDFLEPSLLHLFRLTQSALVERFAHDLEHYGLREKDARLNLDEPSFFSKTYQSVIKILGLGSVPAVYRSEKAKGMRNAYLFPSAFLIGNDLLSGRSEKEVAFVCAKALTLFRPEFFLTQFGGVKVLEGLLYTIFKTFRPDLNVDLSKNMQRISKDMGKKLKLDEQALLRTIVDARIESGANLDIKLYVEAAEDTANRVGLLFCDDPAMVQRLLEEEENSISNRSVGERLGSLLMWGISDQFMELREKLNLAIETWNGPPMSSG